VAFCGFTLWNTLLYDSKKKASIKANEEKNIEELEKNI